MIFLIYTSAEPLPLTSIVGPPRDTMTTFQAHKRLCALCVQIGLKMEEHGLKNLIQLGGRKAELF